MGELTRVTQAVRSGAADMSHVTDLTIVDGQLYASTRHDGTLDSWTISGGGLSLRDAQSYAGTLRPGDTGWITPLDVATGTLLLTGGATSGGLFLSDPDAAGGRDTPVALTGTTNTYGTLHHTTAITAENGTHVVYGGIAGQTGLAQLTFNGAGDLIGRRTVADLDRTYGTDIAGTATATVGGTTYIYTASATEHGISSWSVARNGTLTAAQDMGNPDGLWISAPTAPASVALGGQTFLVLAAAGTDSLTVVRTRPDGSLQIVDHLLDARETRFGGVAALEVVSHNGAVYVIAGGTDDGITVLQMLPDGQLVTRATIADTTGMTLDNVSAIAATGSGDGLDIFVSSSSEDGITRLRYDAGPAGQTLVAAAGQTLIGTTGTDVLIGSIGDDRLNGGQGDDILRDGGDIDVMAGGAGANTFVFAEGRDRITDFDINLDCLSLGVGQQPGRWRRAVRVWHHRGVRRGARFRQRSVADAERHHRLDRLGRPDRLHLVPAKRFQRGLPDQC